MKVRRMLLLLLIILLTVSGCVMPQDPSKQTATQHPTTQQAATVPSTGVNLPLYNGSNVYTDEGAVFAPYVYSGSNQIYLSAAMNYFLFIPGEAGEYTISLTCTDGKLGYYGRGDFVRNESLLDFEAHTVSLTVRESMISEEDPYSTGFVIGIEFSGSPQTCTMMIQRAGDPVWDVSEEPWIIYEATVALSKYSLPDGARLEEFDLTADTDAYCLVLNESDGFYHLNSIDGPLVLMYLTAPSAYLDELVTVGSVSRIGRYFYDPDGTFVYRESYNECIQQYAQVADKSAGVYPLTEDLMYIIRNHGTQFGWWDMHSRNTCLFLDENGDAMQNINAEIAWLFVCCYIAE